MITIMMLIIIMTRCIKHKITHQVTLNPAVIISSVKFEKEYILNNLELCCVFKIQQNWLQCTGITSDKALSKHK